MVTLWVPFFGQNADGTHGANAHVPCRLRRINRRPSPHPSAGSAAGMTSSAYGHDSPPMGGTAKGSTHATHRRPDRGSLPSSTTDPDPPHRARAGFAGLAAAIAFRGNGCVPPSAKCRVCPPVGERHLPARLPTSTLVFAADTNDESILVPSLLLQAWWLDNAYEKYAVRVAELSACARTTK